MGNDRQSRRCNIIRYPAGRCIGGIKVYVNSGPHASYYLASRYGFHPRIFRDLDRWISFCTFFILHWDGGFIHSFILRIHANLLHDLYFIISIRPLLSFFCGAADAFLGLFLLLNSIIPVLSPLLQITCFFSLYILYLPHSSLQLFRSHIHWR